MKKSLVLLILYFLNSHASSNSISHDSMELELKLINTLQNIREYKKEKNKQVLKLTKKLEEMNLQLAIYKENKEKELKSIKKELESSKKKLLIEKKSKNKLLKNTRKKLNTTKKKLLKKNQEFKVLQKEHFKKNKEVTMLDVPVLAINNIDNMLEANTIDVPVEPTNYTKVTNDYKVVTSEKNLLMAINMAMEQAMNEPISLNKNTQWVEIVIEDNLNIRELALKYYSSHDEYMKIYTANSDVIPSNLELHNDMILKIPITKNFKEQPMILNRD